MLAANECAPGDVPKRIENRRWETDYRGPLLIHAGKARDMLRPGDETKYPDMKYGELIGVVDLIECIPRTWNEALRWTASDTLPWRLSWVPHDLHAEGPWLWIFEKRRRFQVSIPMRGQQGLWDANHDWVPRLISNAELLDEHPMEIRRCQAKEQDKRKRKFLVE